MMILCTCAHKIRTTFSPDPDIITKNRLNVDHNAAAYMLLADEQKKIHGVKYMCVMMFVIGNRRGQKLSCL